MQEQSLQGQLAEREAECTRLQEDLDAAHADTGSAAGVLSEAEERVAQLQRQCADQAQQLATATHARCGARM